MNFIPPTIQWKFTYSNFIDCTSFWHLLESGALFLFRRWCFIFSVAWDLHWWITICQFYSHKFGRIFCWLVHLCYYYFILISLIDVVSLTLIIIVFRLCVILEWLLSVGISCFSFISLEILWFWCCTIFYLHKLVPETLSNQLSIEELDSLASTGIENVWPIWTNNATLKFIIFANVLVILATTFFYLSPIWFVFKALI